MDWFQPIDDYCERLDASLWAEPLNAISNLSFIIAAFVLLQRWAGTGRRPAIALLLIVNVFAIGLGSFLFHTLANRWSMLADVVPITIFIHLYLLLAFRTYLGFPWWLAGAATIAFFAGSPFLGEALRPYMGSSAFYSPALAAIFLTALAVYRRNQATAARLCAAGILFSASIGFRAADGTFCEMFPAGTHLMWHLLNGIVLYLLVTLYLYVTAERPTVARRL